MAAPFGLDEDGLDVRGQPIDRPGSRYARDERHPRHPHDGSIGHPSKEAEVRIPVGCPPLRQLHGESINVLLTGLRLKVVEEHKPSQCGDVVRTRLNDSHQLSLPFGGDKGAPGERRMMGGVAVEGLDRVAIVDQFDEVCRDLHALLARATPPSLQRRSHGTRWTNEQLLFHMVFGFLVVRRLLPLVRLVSRLPAPVGLGFARALDAASVPFHWVNYLGSCGGAVVFNHRRMGRLADRTIGALTASLLREPEGELGRGMPFPTRWDPYFTPFMAVGDVYAYPVLHYRHHRAQLTLD